MKRLCFLVPALLALDAAALPIAPETIWELSAEAELIVVAEVGRAHRQIEAPETFAQAVGLLTGEAAGPERVVRLRIMKVLAGPRLTSVDVHVARFICPAPAVFQEGEQVVAFLARSGAIWAVVGLSYGTLYPRAAELPILEKRILEARALHASHADARRRLSWMVELAVEPVTRWQGLYPLEYELDDLSRSARRAPSEFPPFSSAQLERLTQAFIRKPTTDTTLPMMLMALAEVKNPTLDAVFIGAFETSLAHEDQSLSRLESTLRMLLRRFTTKATIDELLPPRDAATEPSAAAVEQAWRTARDQLSLPKGTRVEPRERTVRGVESDTPL